MLDMKEFKDPSSLYRPAPFWSWNDHLDKEELTRQIHEMADKGWGSYFMHSRVGLVTGYLSEEWMELVRTCAQEAAKTGTYAWLYDEDKWPSGFAGGEVPEMNKDYRSRALVLLKETERTEDDITLLELSKDGESYLICKRISPLGNLWFNGASYVDLMNPEAVQAFIDCTHERYKEACGEYFGKEIPGIFTDEPCYLMEGHYQVPVLPWSEYLPGYFQKCKGYDIQEKLEQLFFDTGDYQKVRFDFFDCATRLFMESFTKKYYTWCENNNLKMTGHFMAEDSLTYQTQWVGAAMPHYQFMHWPGIDKLGRHIEQLVTVKQLTSVVDQLDKERAFCEVFGCVGQQVSFYHRKWIADWQAALGISFVNSHLSLYSMRGERKRDYPANLFYQQPWWEEEKAFSDYLGRVSYAVSAGKREVDILVIHSVGSVWSEYSPLHKAGGLAVEKGLYDKPFEELSKTLIANKLDFHYGDEIIMEEHAKVEGNQLVVGTHRYSTVIVPPCCTLRENTVKLLEQFVAAAGKEKLIFVKIFPDRINGVKAKLDILDNALKQHTIAEVISTLDGYYQDRLRITDRVTGKNAEKVICHSRNTDEGRITFIVNTDEKREIKASIKIKGMKPPKFIDLMSGEIYEVPAELNDGTCVVDVTFDPSGSLLLLEDDEKAVYPQVPCYLDSGIEFNTDDQTGICAVLDWKAGILEENVLPLNDVTLYMGGEKVLDREPVAKAWHQHFYKAANGTEFKAEYRFDVLHVPQGSVFAAIEAAENLDRILINGMEVKSLKQKGELGAFDKDKSWKDINFTRVPLDGLLKQGENVLVLEGKKVNNITGPGFHTKVEDVKEHMPTEVETVYIVGDFKVSDIDREIFMVDSRNSAVNPSDLTASGYPFYAGKAEFQTQFRYDGKHKKLTLKLCDVEAAYVALYVNGEYVAAKYWKPYVADITPFLNEGDNEIKVVAATTLFNVMGPNRIVDIKNAQGVGPGSFIDFNRYTRQYALFPFGIGKGIVIED